MLKHPKIALDFSGAKFSLRLFVPHEFEMADGTSLKSGKAMLTIPYRYKATTHSFHEFKEKHLQELLLTGTLHGLNLYKYRIKSVLLSESSEVRTP